MRRKSLDKRAVRPAKCKGQKNRLQPHVDRLYKAVANYIKRNGGSVLVIGPSSCQEWPSDPAHVFHISVKCLGRKPKYSEDNKNLVSAP